MSIKADLIKQVMELADYPENWNSYGGKTADAVSLKSAVTLANALPNGAPYPTAMLLGNGNIEFEWNVLSKCFSITCRENGTFDVSYVDSPAVIFDREDMPSITSFTDILGLFYRQCRW